MGVNVPRYFALSLMLLLSASAPSWADFTDPLDAPAMLQSNPSARPLIGAASAGSRVVAVGLRGFIVVMAEEGMAWEQAEVPVQSDLVSVYFPTEKRGWAVGHDGVIVRSDDGGKTWAKSLDGRMAKELFIDYYESLVEEGIENAALALEETQLNFRDGPTLPYLGVWFENEDRGFAVGAFGMLAATEDGGRTWEPWSHRINNEQGLHLNSISGVGEDVFIVSERGVLFRLDRDGGRFLSVETGYTGTFFGITGSDDVLLAYGLRGTVYRSEDRGESWEQLQMPSRATITSGTFQSDGSGFVLVNQAGELLISDSRARTFKVADAVKAMAFTSVVSLREGRVLTTGIEGAGIEMPQVKVMVELND